MAKAYALFQSNLQDGEKFGRYVPPAVASVMAHGGKLLVAAENSDIREGALSTGRTAIIEFPSREAAVRWYECAEYQAVIHLRHEATTDGSCVILDGFEPPSA